MNHVLWIGGPPGSGKTAVARRLARRYGLRLYSADTRTWVHRDRALNAGIAPAQRWESLDPSHRWNQSPEELVAMSLHAERGSMVIDDLSSLPVSPLIVAEGSILPASAVSSGIAERSRSMWLLPTTPFFETHLPSPDSGEGPRELYRLLRKTIEQEVEEHDVPSLKADGTLLEAEMVTVLAGYFRDALTEGPTASSTEDRQQLLREMNEAIVAQVEGYYARPWAKGNPDVVECAFVCECGRPECDADMVLAMGEVATGRPVLVPGHSGQT